MPITRKSFGEDVQRGALTPKIHQAAMAHAVFIALATRLWKTHFCYIDNVEHEATLMNVLMAGTDADNNCITAPIDFIMKDIRKR